VTSLIQPASAVTTAPPCAPPGWYPDPYGGPGRRYWDGGNWWTDAEMKDAHRRFVKPHVIAMMSIVAALFIILDLVERAVL
jgi:hypothetical protein